MDIINRCELSNRRNNHIRAIFLEIAIKSNEYPDFRARSNRDKFDCEDSYIYLLCFFMRYFDYKDIKRRRVYRKNDLIEFFVYDNLINLQNISFDQEINDDFSTTWNSIERHRTLTSEASLKMTTIFGKYIDKTI